jgi:hypothetical protein
MGKGVKWRCSVLLAHRTVSIFHQTGRQMQQLIRMLHCGPPLHCAEKVCSFTYMRSFVADGNMKAVHLKQKNNESEVPLTHGEAFMTNEERY